MASFYPYLISSLPMLQFGAQAPFSYQAFLLRCKELIPESDFQMLDKLASQDAKKLNHAIIKQWFDFDTMLRNELVKIRAAHKKVDSEKYLRAHGYAGASIYHIALAAHRNPSPLEGERILDQARWGCLDELTFGHYFDLGFLIIYAYKLLILQRWDGINSADTERLIWQ